MKSLYDQAREEFTPELMNRLEGYFGATPVMLDRAIRAAVSALTSGAIDRASTEEGATALLAHLDQPAAIASKTDPRAAIEQGKSAAAYLLGPRLAAASDVVANASNVAPAAAAGLLALGAPIVLSVLASVHSTDATEFEALLTGQRENALDSGPAAVTSLIEDGGLTWRHILPMVLIGLLLLTVPFLYRGCGDPQIATEAETRAIVPPVQAVQPQKIEPPPSGAAIAVPSRND
jgi:hypothetical protein